MSRLGSQKSLAELLPGLPPFYTGGGASTAATATSGSTSTAPSQSRPAVTASSMSRQPSLADVLPGLKAIMPAYVGEVSSLSTSSSVPVLGSQTSTMSAPKFAPPAEFGDLAFVAARVMAENEGPPIAPRTLKVAILLPDPIDWNIEWQIFSPDVAGGIRKRLPALFRFAAATYFPEITFEFDEYIFEHYHTWPQGDKLAAYDCVFVTGAKEGAYDQHVPYVPVLEKYIGDNVNLTRWIGLSYGHQTIAWGMYPGAMTGKNVIKNPTGWENAAVESVITKEGQKALNTKKKFYYVHNHHGDTVLLAPPGTTACSFSSQTPVQCFISDRVFTNEGHIEYSAGIMSNWGCWDSTWGFYTREKYLEYLSDRVFTPACDNRLNYLPDAIWLCGKMIGWLARKGKVPSDEELDARKARFQEWARPIREAIEHELCDVEYARKVAEFGGIEKVKAIKEKWRRWIEEGVPFKW